MTISEAPTTAAELDRLRDERDELACRVQELEVENTELREQVAWEQGRKDNEEKGIRNGV